MRLFIAIDLPESWRELLAKPQESIGWLGRGVKWVDPKSTHLTLKFLGEVAPNLLDPVKLAAARACEQFPAFTICMKGTGVFPDPKRPRIYWAGVQAPETLLGLQAEIEREMEELGFEHEERKFNPHLTIARIKEPAGKQRMTEALLSFKMESEPVEVKETLLIRSHLSEDGARYEPLAYFPLSHV
jgi:RNA 2',3'-cyclic 3'-phosphodiesterase